MNNILMEKAIDEVAKEMKAEFDAYIDSVAEKYAFRHPKFMFETKDTIIKRISIPVEKRSNINIVDPSTKLSNINENKLNDDLNDEFSAAASRYIARNPGFAKVKKRIN